MHVDEMPAVVMAAVSYETNAVVTKAGDLYVEGKNGYAMLGINAMPRNIDVPWTRVPPELFNNELIIQVALGGTHSVALGIHGHVFTAGTGYFGCLGHGNEEHSRVFQRVTALDNEVIAFVAAGAYASAMVGTSGRVWVCGENTHGCLGLGDETMRLEPVQIPEFGAARTVYVSMHDHVAAVQSDNTVYVWGHNNYWQLGLGDDTDRLQPVRLAFEPVVSVVCGVYRTFLLAVSGAVYWCGRVRYNTAPLRALAPVAHIPRAVSITMGLGWSYGVVSDIGECYCWNERGYVQQPMHRPLPARVGLFHRLPDMHKVAFAMITHERLGRACALNTLPTEIIRLAIDMLVSWPSGPVGELDGLVRLLGGTGIHAS